MAEQFRSATTLREAVALIGSQVSVISGELQVTCKILDVRASYGDFHYLVSPVCGCGEQWITPGKIKSFCKIKSLVAGAAE